MDPNSTNNLYAKHSLLNQTHTFEGTFNQLGLFDSLEVYKIL